MSFKSLKILMLLMLSVETFASSNSSRCIRSFSDSRTSLEGTDFKSYKTGKWLETIDGKETVYEGVMDSIVKVPLSTENILKAYQNGGFPWNPNSKGSILWWNPKEHGYASVEKLFNRTGKKMRNLRAAWNKLENNDWVISYNKAFDHVIKRSAEQERDVDVYGHVWLTPEVQKAYKKLHKEGFAHSVEVWDKDGNLIGGVYGIMHRQTFSAESMFHLVGDAGKVAVLALIERLYIGGHRILDTQTVNENTRTNYKAELDSREDYLAKADLEVKNSIPMKTEYLFPEGFFGTKNGLRFLQPVEVKFKRLDYTPHFLLGTIEHFHGS